MSLLSAAVGAGVSTRNRLYDRGIFRARRLRWPVVSIGNLRVGGAGKTPFTIHLGELLLQRMIAFDVLSRGYRRMTRGVLLVDEKGSALQYGDEPLLIAKRLEVPVIVGEDRFAAGAYAEKTFTGLQPAHSGTWLHLLDDGFQHRRLARDFDIVLLTPSDVTDTLLPSGRLREPLTSLARADAIVLPEGVAIESLPKSAQSRHIWRVTRHIEVPPDAPRQPIVFCGIARPERLYDDLERAGVRMVRAMQFSDHHVYSPPDVRALLALKQEHASDGFLTTEKDIVNLAAKGLLKELMPLSVVRLRMQLADPENAVDIILGTIAQRSQCR
jgi:tetraacyldisaccharide 4'-kinase